MPQRNVSVLARFTILCLTLLATPWAQADDVATPWEQSYEGINAKGPHVLGLWKFDTEDGVDSSGKNPRAEIRNGKLSAAGRFGGAFESFVGYPEADQSHGFIIANSPRLSPGGAFTLELWIKPKPEFAQRDWSVLIDKKYAGHDDYQLSIGAADGKQQRQLTLSLGFSSESQNFLSEPAAFMIDEWVHVAATYDGKGKVRFFRNGESLGGADAPGRGAISAGSLALSIGDRLGSSFPGFPGYLDEVRLTSGVREFGQVRIQSEWPRKAFVRFEPAPKWTASIRNLSPKPITGATLHAIIEGHAVQQAALPEIAPGSVHTAEFTFDTALRPDNYPVVLNVTVPGEPSRQFTETTTIHLVPRQLPNRMPVVMWGIGGVTDVVTELPRLKQIGFTHCLGGDVDYKAATSSDVPVSMLSPERVPAAIEMLDTALVNDFRILAATSPSYFASYLKEHLQVDREGKIYKREALTPNVPKVLQAFEMAGASIAKTYADHPAFEGVLANSEIRDESEVSFSESDLAAYRQAFGPTAEFPEWVTSKYPPSYTTLKDFPSDRVIPEDHPQLQFYRWWWSVGDGWNAAHSAVHRGMHAQSQRKDLWSFNDPVVRCPPLWGSGGEVDVLSQWTYTDPDPLRMSLPVDELFAMAGGRQPAARVMKMTQLFWYRSTTAPAEKSPRDGDSPAKWADKDPNTSFFSIHPHHLREAFWTKIARPIEGIMYHGWSSLVPTDGSHAYKYTHPQLQHELTRLIHDVVQPLGPALRQIPAAKSDVAFLESFTTFAFTSKSTWGYAGGWQSDVYFALQHAHLQPEVIYEQHVLRDGLKDYKVLVLSDCEVLTQPVVNEIHAFQKSGGIVIGDSNLCPAIKADFNLVPFRRQKDAAADKAQLLKLAAEIRDLLDGRYQRVVETTSPNVVPHRRRAGSADYVFLVNDAREPGDYVGQYGLVHEQGVPTTADVRLRSNAAAVYDLVTHQSVPFQHDSATGDLIIPVTLSPCDGKLLMAVEKPISKASVTGADEITRGAQWTGDMQILDANDQPVNAVIPVHVEVFDAEGRLSEFSGYHAAVEGHLTVTLDIASNDQQGVWEMRVRELASGQRSQKFFRVK
jgi:hypothetical protein